MAEQPIDIDDIIGELKKIFSSDTCGIFIPCTGSTKLWQRIHDTKMAQIDAQGRLPIHLQTIRKTKLSNIRTEIYGLSNIQKYCRNDRLEDINYRFVQNVV